MVTLTSTPMGTHDEARDCYWCGRRNWSINCKLTAIYQNVGEGDIANPDRKETRGLTTDHRPIKK